MKVTILAVGFFALFALSLCFIAGCALRDATVSDAPQIHVKGMGYNHGSGPLPPGK